jgi:hypothetical protein
LLLEQHLSVPHHTKDKETTTSPIRPLIDAERPTNMASNGTVYSPVLETSRIFSDLCEQSERLGLPTEVVANKDRVSFSTSHNEIYFPIPFKETETLAALKGVEGSVAAAIADLRFGRNANPRGVQVSLEGATAFGCQAYMAKVDGLSKLDPNVKSKLKGKRFFFHSLLWLFLMESLRYGSVGGPVEWLPSHVGEPLQDQEPRRVLPYSWIT